MAEPVEKGRRLHKSLIYASQSSDLQVSSISLGVEPRYPAPGSECNCCRRGLRYFCERWYSRTAPALTSCSGRALHRGCGHVFVRNCVPGLRCHALRKPKHTRVPKNCLSIHNDSLPLRRYVIHSLGLQTVHAWGCCGADACQVALLQSCGAGSLASSPSTKQNAILEPSGTAIVITAPNSLQQLGAAFSLESCFIDPLSERFLPDIAWTLDGKFICGLTTHGQLFVLTGELQHRFCGPVPLGCWLTVKLYGTVQCNQLSHASCRNMKPFVNNIYHLFSSTRLSMSKINPLDHCARYPCHTLAINTRGISQFTSTTNPPPIASTHPPAELTSAQ